VKAPAAELSRTTPSLAIRETAHSSGEQQVDSPNIHFFEIRFVILLNLISPLREVAD
jgi:hypothetical protein